MGKQILGLYLNNGVDKHVDLFQFSFCFVSGAFWNFVITGVATV